MTLITVVLNSNGNNVYYDTKALLDYGFDNFHKVNVAQNDSRFQNTESVTLKSPFCNDNSSISIDDSACVVIPKKAKFADLTSEISLEFLMINLQLLLTIWFKICRNSWY